MRDKDQILQGEDEEYFLYECKTDLGKWCRRVLGLEIKPFHQEWLNLLTTKDRIAIRAPTGFGKTSIFGVAYPLWLTFFRPKTQILILAKTIRTQSANILEEIKSTIENNELLKEMKPEDIKSYWTKEKINTLNESRIFYSSYSINVRGVHVNYVFADESATYPETETFFENVITRAVSKKGKIAAVSTPVSSVDLMARLFQNSSYFSKDYPAIVNGKSIWPERFPMKTLMEIKKEIGVTMFEKNYMVNPKAEAENAIYTADSIEDCYDYNGKFTSEDFGGDSFLGCDFAVASGPTADYDAYVVVEKKGDKVIIKHGETQRGVSIAGKIMRIQQLNDLFKPNKIIIDESSIGAAILQDLRNKGMVVDPQSFQSKARTQLLMNLKRIIDNKLLVIPKSRDDQTRIFIDRLEEELLGFKETRQQATDTVRYLSTSAHDDTVMALAMACKPVLYQQPFDDFIGVG